MARSLPLFDRRRCQRLNAVADALVTYRRGVGIPIPSLDYPPRRLLTELLSGLLDWSEDHGLDLHDALTDALTDALAAEGQARFLNPGGSHGESTSRRHY